MPYSPRLALRVGERQSWVKCLVQEHNVAAAGSDGSSLPTQSHFTATPGDQAFEPPSGFESPTLSITSRARYRLSHRATTLGCQWKLKICTYNARSLSSDDRLHELEDELDRINFDIVGICETRRKGEGCLTLNKSGHQFYYKGGNTQITYRCWTKVGPTSAVPLAPRWPLTRGPRLFAHGHMVGPTYVCLSMCQRWPNIGQMQAPTCCPPSTMPGFLDQVNTRRYS